MNAIQQTITTASNRRLRFDLPLPEKAPPYTELEQGLRRDLAVRLYLGETVTIGQAAEIAGMRRVDFEMFLGKHEIPISLLTREDISDELDMARRHRRTAETAGNR